MTAATPTTVPSRRRWLLPAVVTLLLVTLPLVCSASSGPLEFSRTGWDQGEREGDPAQRRQRMADGLLERRQLIGLTRPEVVTLLGEPPPTGYFSSWSMVYWLGTERGLFAIDSEWLVLKLDDAGRVVDARLLTD